MYEARVMSTRDLRTFARAMSDYLDAGRPEPKFAAKIATFFGERLCSEIDNSFMLQAKKALFPENAKAGYVNRHLYCPVIAILRMASKDKVCDVPNFTRPKGYADVVPVECPTDDTWYPRVMREINPNARAIIALLTVHGRRVSELLDSVPEDFNPVTGTLRIDKTKTNDPKILVLEPRVHALMLEMPGWERRTALFNYKTVNGVNYAIQDACKRAKVPYYSTHKLGRHRFALRLLDAGYSLQHVKDAGGWKTIKVLSDHYGSLAKTEHTLTVHKIGGQVMSLVDGGAKVGRKASPVLGILAQHTEK